MSIPLPFPSAADSSPHALVPSWNKTLFSQSVLETRYEISAMTDSTPKKVKIVRLPQNRLTNDSFLKAQKAESSFTKDEQKPLKGRIQTNVDDLTI
jgi:hypothetical protein